MKKISFTDVLVATVVTSRGDRVSMRIEGVDSMQAVYMAAKKAASALYGVMTLTVRNITRGWCHSECIYKRGSVSLSPAWVVTDSTIQPPMRVESPVQLQFAF